ncbi:hypothetical protein CDL15_Pgr028950 [Punica granatum]|uniref:PGG domain-containing protein n=1 Tax=Punica granatum TaxID=22663 RepID=A0A218WXC8_PUNGR|nr:hypothetical protein CDL15_Pgr028950 [Punica granatum]
MCKLKDKGGDLRRYQDLYKAALAGDWETAERTFESDPEAKTAIVSTRQETALHVATSMGQTRFLEKLVQLLSPKDLEMTDCDGQTALHIAAIYGSLDAVKTPLKKNKMLTQMVGAPNGVTALFSAAYYDSKDVMWHLTLNTTADPPPRPFTGPKAGGLIRGLVWSGSYAFGAIKCIKDEKYKHKCTRRLVEIACQEISRSGTILQEAVTLRQEKVLNLMLDKNAINKIISNIKFRNTGQKLLHLAAKLSPYPELSSISCPALQMQRELLWFQDTANSCMVVSTLIATVIFAATFTVPGGNVEGKGIPLFLSEQVFMLFAVSDALALFSSTTAILMFLSILTARYAEEDFLRALPKRLILGFASLFLAIATMLVAFGAALYMVLSERFKWIFLPIIAITSVPVALFVMLQLPLFIFMVKSTYGSGIFHPKKIW